MHSILKLFALDSLKSPGGLKIMTKENFDLETKNQLKILNDLSTIFKNENLDFCCAVVGQLILYLAK